MDSDGTDQRVLAAGFEGGGPMWSPDGTRIVYQRSCVQLPDPAGIERLCSEFDPSLGIYYIPVDKAVVVTVNDHDPLGPFGTQTVIPPPRTTAADGSTTLIWYPNSVTWSPDSTALLYHGTAESDPSLQMYVEGLVVVPVHGGAPPIALVEQAGPLWNTPGNTSQSWARQPE